MGCRDIALRGPDAGRTGAPWTGPPVVFEQDGATVSVAIFCDGGSERRARFMPPAQGRWTWRFAGGDGWQPAAGALDVGPPPAGNHGPLREVDGGADGAALTLS